MIKYALSTLTFLYAVLTFAQEAAVPCLHNDLELLAPLHQHDPQALQQMVASEAELEHFTVNFDHDPASRDEPYVIPVVFHIIHNDGAENISNAQVEDAMRVLNDDFNKLNPDWVNADDEFIDLVADVGIEFRLARRDPNGNCTNGITRTMSPLTNDGDQAMKNLIQWPRDAYLNVWVAASAGGAAGYTYRPASVSGFPTGDGIVMMHTYVGTIGTGAPSRSRTLTHEVGHWLNLKHTWGGTNEPELATNCNDDDNVGDTPNTIGWTTCNLSGSSCGSNDNVENYMEYASCRKMFTVGQATRMIAALNSGVSQRNQLWQTNNLQATGVSDDGELCAAVFSSNATIVCAGTAISFEDESFHNVISRTWSFPGGTPSTSTDPDPVVIYDEAGTYPVTLTVSDGTSSITTTSDQQVVVLPVPGSNSPLQESFETIDQFSGSDWSVIGTEDGNTYVVTPAASYSGQRSARLSNDSWMDGEVNELISGTFDMSEADNVSITFRYAYAQRNNSNDDRLRVYVSANCGETWSLRKQLRGTTDLSTAPDNNGSFVPNGPDQWGYAEVTNIAPSTFTGEFRFKFHFESDGGNNLYLDDINVNGMPVSVGEIEAVTTGLAVVPNPANDQAQLHFDLINADHTRIDLLDVLGRTIATLHDGQLAAGAQRFDLPVEDLRSGIYFVRLQNGARSDVVRFVVE